MLTVSWHTFSIHSSSTPFVFMFKARLSQTVYGWILSASSLRPSLLIGVLSPLILNVIIDVVRLGLPFYYLFSLCPHLSCSLHPSPYFGGVCCLLYRLASEFIYWTFRYISWHYILEVALDVTICTLNFSQSSRVNVAPFYVTYRNLGTNRVLNPPPHFML